MSACHGFSLNRMTCAATALCAIMMVGASTIDGQTSAPSSDLFKTGVEQYDNRLFTEAVRTFSGFVARHPESKLVPDAMFFVADSNYNLGNYTDAVKGFDTLITRYPKHTRCEEALFTKAWALFELRKEKEGLSALELVVKKYPKGEFASKALYSIGDFHHNTQHYEEAEKAYRDLLLRYPGSEAARKVPKILKELGETIAYLHYERAFMILTRAEKTHDRALYRQAAEKFELTILEYPDTESATGAYANALLCREELGDWEKALSHIDSLISRQKESTPPGLYRYRERIEEKLSGKKKSKTPPFEKRERPKKPPKINVPYYAISPLFPFTSLAAEKQTFPPVSRNHGNTVYLFERSRGIDGTEIVKANGMRLIRGADYSIDFKAETVVFLDKKLMSTDTFVEILYKSSTPPKPHSHGFWGRRSKSIPEPKMVLIYYTGPLRWNPKTERFEPRAGVLRGSDRYPFQYSNIQPLRLEANPDGTFTTDGSIVARSKLYKTLKKKLPRSAFDIVLSGQPDTPLETLRFMITSARNAKANSINWDPSINRQMEEIILADGR